MQAIVIDKPGSAACQQVSDPKPGADECLLRPVAAGICGTDVHIFQGDFIGSYPIIPCHEFSARVIASGAAVHTVQTGDLVAVDPNIRCGQCPACRRSEINLCEHYQAIGVTRPGGFAGLVCAPALNLHKVAGGDSAAAAFTEPLACVLYGQSRLTWQPGMRVIIWGAGAIGLLHLQVCQRLRGATVTVVDKNPDRVKAALELGADRGIILETPSEKELRESTWDVAMDATGSTAAVIEMFKYLRRGGQALVFGVYPGDEYLSLSPMGIFYHDWSIVGSFTYRHEFSQAVQLLSSGVLSTTPLIGTQIDLHQVPDVLRRLAGGERLGKVQVLL